jgi:D-alanyl-D-alanine carboxypeptidase/D-alanyl-D-alanine-endopeptidase (penicillin-binding protein 4)
MLFRRTGAEYTKRGSHAAAIETVTTFADAFGVGRPGVQVIRDGSGLSPQNMTTASQIVALLTALRKSRYADGYTASLAAAGEGTVKRRFGKEPFLDRVFVKTGTLSGVTALSGYIKRDDGWIVFAMIANDNKVTTCLNVHTAIVDRLCRWER